MEVIPVGTSGIEPLRTTKINRGATCINVKNPCLGASHTTGETCPKRVGQQCHIHLVDSERSTLAKHDTASCLNAHANVVLSVEGNAQTVCAVSARARNRGICTIGGHRAILPINRVA